MSAPRLSDLLTKNHALEIWCRRCPHQRTIPAAEAVAMFGAETTFSAVSRLAKCAACGARGRDGHIGCRASISDYYRDLGMTASHAQGIGFGLSEPSRRQKPAAP